ncbi:hypothetical protein AMECASPLE_002326 [Ameca splendens]|uniref:Uncharacterized protein n=1 Tax=Ameca splendens TaxID=208324 RepID=A0ABV0YWB2_9TELE
MMVLDAELTEGLETPAIQMVPETPYLEVFCTGFISLRGYSCCHCFILTPSRGFVLKISGNSVRGHNMDLPAPGRRFGINNVKFVLSETIHPLSEAHLRSDRGANSKFWFCPGVCKVATAVKDNPA